MKIPSYLIYTCIMRILLWLIGLYIPFCVSGQSTFVNSPASLGRGATGVTSADVWSPILNPAGTSQVSSASASVAYHLPYLVNELSSKSALGMLPFRFGVISAYVNQYGYSLYQETKFGVAYARSLAPNLHASFQLNFQNTHLSQSGSGSQLFAGLGVIYEPMEAVKLGFYISNPEQSSITVMESTTEIPSLFVLGFNWRASPDFDISCEVEKQNGFDMLYKMGLEYSINQKVWIRTGVLGKPVNYTLGLGFDVMGFLLDAGIAHHEVLGMSSCFGIAYQFKPKQ